MELTPTQSEQSRKEVKEIYCRTVRGREVLKNTPAETKQQNKNILT